VIRFYPLADSPRDGILVVRGGRPTIASFWTPQEAKALAGKAKK
jgi:hypothetical protein